jgi:transposase
VDAGVVRWRPEGEGPPARQRISSPYDPEARWGVKRQTHWLGYKVHLTETCAPNAPHLITQVTTTTAPVPDGAVLEPLHADLAARDLLPQEHLVDSGYVSAAVLVRSQVAYGVQVVGPVLADTSWQARTAGGIELGQFTVDWEHEQATCPAGHTSTTWTPSHDRHGHATVAIQFGRRDCGECGLRAACTRSAQQGRRLVVRPEAEQLALERARLEQRTVEFATRYAARAGIEGTLSEAVAVCGLRRSRYRGLAKTQLQQVLTAAALNVRRLAAWWEAHPTATTRRAPFVRLLHLAA